MFICVNYIFRAVPAPIGGLQPFIDVAAVSAMLDDRNSKLI